MVNPPFMGRVKLRITEFSCESETLTEKVTDIPLGGVPERRPLEPSVNQLGSPEADQL